VEQEKKAVEIGTPKGGWVSLGVNFEKMVTNYAYHYSTFFSEKSPCVMLSDRV
jgi:hypothetical protein